MDSEQIRDKKNSFYRSVDELERLVKEIGPTTKGFVFAVMKHNGTWQNVQAGEAFDLVALAEVLKAFTMNHLMNHQKTTEKKLDGKESASP